jgi:hypothetical protein
MFGLYHDQLQTGIPNWLPWPVPGSTSIIKNFARKIIRTAHVPRAEIENEAQMVARLKDGEQHTNTTVVSLGFWIMDGSNMRRVVISLIWNFVVLHYTTISIINIARK